MKEITKAKELIAVSVRQGLDMDSVEAQIVLGYIEGMDFAIMSDDDFKTMLHDNQDGEKNDEDEEYTVRDFIEMAVESNTELTEEARTSDSHDEKYLCELEKDGYILDKLVERAKVMIKAQEKEYKVVIMEYLKMVVPVMAESWAEAEVKVKDGYRNEEYVLTADNYAGTTFSLGG